MGVSDSKEKVSGTITSKQNNNITYKPNVTKTYQVLFAGDSGVGKSSLIHKLLKDGMSRSFEPSITSVETKLIIKGEPAKVVYTEDNPFDREREVHVVEGVHVYVFVFDV